MSKSNEVTRPRRKTEYRLEFATGRIWYAVIQPGGGKSPGKVLLERVTTGHPNETIKQHR